MTTERSWQGTALKYTGQEHSKISDLAAEQPYIADESLIEAVNLAISLERPLLISGESGCGKTKLAQAVAHELGLPLVRWYIRSTSRARDGLYTYDAESHLRDAQLVTHNADSTASQRIKDVSHYVRLGPLGQAFCNSKKTVVLIDKIDQGDSDFPDDLLLELSHRKFCIEETGQIIEMRESPIVFITYNGEKELSARFVRPCLPYHIAFPSPDQLLKIVYSIYPKTSSKLVNKSIQKFMELRAKVLNDTGVKPPGVGHFLGWFQVLKQYPTDESLLKLDSGVFDKWIFSAISRSVNDTRVERSIEFPPEYWEAGTSILSYFSRTLNVKYPDGKIKVRIEQEGLILRMIIDSPDGQREKVEKALEDYAMVIAGKLKPEQFLDDPFEVMALKNKLEIAGLELRQTKQLLDFTRDSSQQRIESLEVKCDKLYSIIENGLQSGNYVFEVVRKMSEQSKSTYNISHAKFGGGFAAEGGHQEGGQFNDYSIQVGVNVDEITKLIQSLKSTIQTFPEEQRVDINIEIEDLQADLSDEQRRNPERLGKHVRSLWLAACAIAVGVAGVADFSNNLLELSEKLNIPIPIELIQQNPHILPGN